LFEAVWAPPFREKLLDWIIWCCFFFIHSASKSVATSVDMRLPALFIETQEDSLASSRRAVYSKGAVNQPFINVEEKIDRLVGRRTKTPDALSTATSNQAESIAWRKAFGGVRVPRGVHRFKTHEEADQWLWRMIARPTN
jgi:hypothetical protein